MLTGYMHVRSLTNVTSLTCYQFHTHAVRLLEQIAVNAAKKEKIVANGIKAIQHQEFITGLSTIRMK